MAIPSLSINDVTHLNEGRDNNAIFTVTLSEVYSADVTVDYITSDGTATAGLDYTTTSGTLTIPAGDTSTDFIVEVLQDSLDEANETVTLTISNPTNATISDATGTLTIIDEDATPSLSINDVTAANENAANATFTVTLSAASSLDVTVDYATSDGTATADVDYTPANGTLTIPAGSTTATFTVGVLSDALDEANETVTLTLSNPTNATISDATATLTITDDDPTPSISFNELMDDSYDGDGVSSSGSEPFTALTVYLSAAAGRDVTVDYAVTGTATEGTDFSLPNGYITIPAGDTTGEITISNINSSLANVGKTIIVTISSPANASLGDEDVHTYTILRSLDRRVNDLESIDHTHFDPTTIEGRVTALETGDTNVANAITTLTGLLTTLQSEFDALETKVQNFGRIRILTKYGNLYEQKEDGSWEDVHVPSLVFSNDTINYWKNSYWHWNKGWRYIPSTDPYGEL